MTTAVLIIIQPNVRSTNQGRLYRRSFSVVRNKRNSGCRSSGAVSCLLSLSASGMFHKIRELSMSTSRSELR